MAEERVERRLAAILAADVVGYSRLMRADEAGTRTRFNAHLAELISPKISEHRGRLVKTTGDGLLVEFASVVDAVQCAFGIQRGMDERNSDTARDQRLDFRIGVNLGDVIIEGDDIHGDGVNVASRLEGLAAPGGVCVSANVFGEIRYKLELVFEDIGEQDVKNIPQLVRAYRLITKFDRGSGTTRVPSVKSELWKRPGAMAAVAVLIGAIGGALWWQPWATDIEPALIERMAHKLPDRPSVAVLPFTNMSDDKGQEFFADGITEDIITDLSKISGLFVVARNSTFTYKGKAVKVRQIAEELGVHYVLEGSVRKVGDRVRITAQLIDAVAGRHVWAEHYDRKLEDIFAVGDDVTRNVVGELAVALKARDHERLYRRHTKSLDAYQAFLRAKHLSGFDLESRQRKETAYQRVVELDPEFAGGYAGLSLAYRQYATHVVGPARKEYIKRAFEFAQQAMAKDDTFVWSYLALGGAYYAKREHDKAVITMKRSVDLQPNDADAWTFLGFYLHWAGHGNEAIVALKTAQRLNPKFISRRNVVFLAMAYSTAGKYRKAIETILPHYASFARRGRPAMGYLAAAYAANGDRKKAQATMKEYLAKKPKYRISNYPMLKNYKRAEDRERFAALLRKAGMPERATVAPVNEKSIAVLPFKNMSDDKAHEYFSDGITEDIITDLSKLSKLFVVARKSSFRFKGRTVDPKQVGRELRASYLLEGSVRRAGDRLRISAQLIDATTGGELWSERYDGKLADTFALQDKVTARIIDAMSLELGAKEREKLADHGTDNFAAHDAFLKGQSYARQYTSEGFARAIREFERALKLDPQYKRASAAIAQTRFINENSGLR